jgi:hypothetical protein
VEYSRKPGEILNVLLKNDVCLVQSGLRAGSRVIIDLYGERRPIRDRRK